MGCGCSITRNETGVLVLEGSNSEFFSNYKLENKIGEGAFGQVRAACGLTTGREYAVKIIDVRRGGKDKFLDQSILKEARQECNLLGQVAGSDHVVMLYECYLEQPGIVYMVMERCYGSLMDRLCDFPKMSEARLSSMFRELLLGIVVLHEVNILHRDVKLDNFLFGGEDRELMKLADFGLAAKLFQGSMKGVSGTAPYMSPEMLANSGYNTKTDVWSLAVTAYIIIFGDCPYSPKEVTASTVKKAIISATPPPTWARPEKLAQQYSPPPLRAEEFVRSLLKRNPVERPSGREALQHSFVFEGLGADGGQMVDTGVRHARSFTDKFKRRGDPIVRRNLDKVLKRLNEAGPALPAGTEGSREVHCFTEIHQSPDDITGAEDEDIRRNQSGKLSATALSCRSEAERRIVRHRNVRNNSHSGVVSEAEFDSLMPLNAVVAAEASCPDVPCRPPPPQHPHAPPLNSVPEFPIPVAAAESMK